MRIADDFGAIAARQAELSNEAHVESRGTPLSITCGAPRVEIHADEIVWIYTASDAADGKAKFASPEEIRRAFQVIFPPPEEQRNA